LLFVNLVQYNPLKDSCASPMFTPLSSRGWVLGNVEDVQMDLVDPNNRYGQEASGRLLMEGMVLIGIASTTVYGGRVPR
jgi:hypothetical protein